MFKIILGIAIITHLAYSADDKAGSGACPPPWKQFEDQCYMEPAYISDDFKTWSDAKDECMNNGGQLATINSPHAQAFLTAAMEYEQQDVWIGLSNLNDTEFTWTDGSALNYTNWGRQQPDGYPESTGTNPPACVVMTALKTEAGKWNDQNCARNLPFYCQMPVDPSLTPPPSGGISLCKPGYISYFQGCFKYVSDYLNFDEAKEECVKDNAHLATIGDAYDEAYIETLMYENGHDSAWIGLQKQPDAVYEWQDGWPVYYTAWGDGEPSGGEGEGCVQATVLGHWDDTMCTKGQPFICKYTDTSIPVPDPTSDGYCDGEYIEYGQHCYLFVTDSVERARTWSDAHDDCASQGATLLTVHSEDENHFILVQLSLRNAASADRSGDPHAEAESDLWLGVTRNNEGGFEYIDGQAVNYVNWGTAEPHDGQGTDCVVMQPDISGHWATSKCDVLSKYGCKKAKLPVTPSQSRTEGSTVTTKLVTTFTPTIPDPISTTEGSTPDDGLSPGAIAGIVVATVVVAGLLAALVAWLIMTKRNSVPHQKFNEDIDISGTQNNAAKA